MSADGTRVLTLSETGEQLVWEVSKLPRTAADPLQALWAAKSVRARGELERRETADALQTLWADLAAQARPAAIAMASLVADPERAVKLFADKLPPAAEANADDVKRWLGELGSPDFKTRQKAEQELNAVADAARSLLRAAADKPANAEAGMRLERILARVETVRSDPDALRVTRAVEVVERIRTPAAVTLLERWAGGAPDALLTTEAKVSLKRVKK